MSKTGVLGSFEEMVLLAVLQQGDRAYGVSIRRELAERTGSDVTIGSVYATLDRLEGKGLVQGREQHEARPGRPRRYYSVLPAGVAALGETRRTREVMWQGIELPTPDTGALP